MTETMADILVNSIRLDIMALLAMMTCGNDLKITFQPCKKLVLLTLPSSLSLPFAKTDHLLSIVFIFTEYSVAFCGLPFLLF